MTPIELFRQNIDRVRELGGFHKAISGLLTAAVDPSDLLRAQHVLAVSALDHFVHEAARLGILQIFDGSRSPTDAYTRFRVSVSALALSSSKAAREALEAEIRLQHSHLSFQQPDRIADAVRLYSDVKLWDEVGALMSRTPKSIKDQLCLVVDRRNKIAHEADLDPGFPGARWPIHASDIEVSVQFIENVCEAINHIA
jgi:hypothetical protein